MLGTVEVRGGCVTHVCNCPRKYVWSFANFFQVLLATLLNGVACEEKEEPVAQIGGSNNTVGTLGAVNPSTTPPRGVGDEEEEHERHICCREFDASCEQILRLINISPKFLQYAGTETVRAFSSMSKSFMNSFNFTDASMFSPSMLVGIQQKDLSRAVNLLGIQDVRLRDVSVAPASVHPFEEFARAGLMRMDATDTALVIEHDKDVVVNAYALPSWVHTEIPTEQKPPPTKDGGDAATAKPSSSQTQKAKVHEAPVTKTETTAEVPKPAAPQAEAATTLEARLTKAEAEAKAAKDLAERLEGQLREIIRTSAAPSASQAQAKIKEILDTLPETTETEAETKKKRSSKGRGLPQTPEGSVAPEGKVTPEGSQTPETKEAPKGKEGKNG